MYVFGVILVPIFPAFSRIRTEYGVSLRIQSEYGKMRTEITPNTDTFHAVTKVEWLHKIQNYLLFFLINFPFL